MATPSPPSEEAMPASERKSMPFMPNFLRKDLAMWLISLNILALLASVFPWALGKQFDSLAPAPVGIHPEWYFMSPFEMLKLLGSVLPGEAGRDRGHAALHARHRAVGSDSLLRHQQGIRSARRAAHYFGLMAVFRCWPPRSLATGRFGKQLLAVSL